MKKFIKKVANNFGIELSALKSSNEQQKLIGTLMQDRQILQNSLNKIAFLASRSNSTLDNFTLEGFLHFAADKIIQSKSQIFQDLFVLYFLKGKQNGFFVDFGATNGIDLNNTYLLETKYHWNGILAEPGKVWKDDLCKNRNCIIDNHCVWSSTGKTLTFNETTIAELSTIHSYADKDFMADQRQSSSVYEVQSISLNDLLAHHNAPYEVDYLSIDTEGSEFEILRQFNFEKYFIKVITVEHNFTPQREDIYNLLTLKGFKRVFEKMSLFDDWYIHSTW